jgi:seryl-tRNA synthetase
MIGQHDCTATDAALARAQQVRAELEAQVSLLEDTRQDLADHAAGLGRLLREQDDTVMLLKAELRRLEIMVADITRERDEALVDATQTTLRLSNITWHLQQLAGGQA